MAVDQITALLLLYYGYEIAAKPKEKQMNQYRSQYKNNPSHSTVYPFQ